jgi:hypothetical protein
MFTDRSTGMLRRVAKYSFVDLTPEQSAHGIRMGAICARDDARIKGLTTQQTSQQPPESHLCADLDKGVDPVRDPELWARHSSSGSGRTVFEERHGKPYQMAVHSTPAVAARSEDVDHD